MRRLGNRKRTTQKRSASGAPAVSSSARPGQSRLSADNPNPSNPSSGVGTQDGDEPPVGAAKSAGKSRWRAGGLLLVAGFLILLAFAVDAPAEVCQVFARKSLSRFDYDSAETWLRRATYVSSRNPTTELLAARVCRRQGRLDEMTQHLSRALLVGGDAKLIELEESLALAQTGGLAAVEQELVTALKEGWGDTDEISDAYANGLAANSRFGPAATVLDAWRTDYPNDPRPDYRLGRLHEYLERWEEAEAAYRKSIARNPEYFPAHYRLGRVLFNGRRIEEAEAAFSACLEMPSPQAAEVQVAMCARALGDLERARELLRQVVRQERSAITASYQAVEENPEHFEAAAQLGDIESELGNFQEALHWLELALAENPRDLTARYSLAVTLRELGRGDEAEIEFERIQVARTALERANPLRDRIAGQPDDLAARLELGELLMEHESQRMARFWLQSILTYDPDHAAAHAALAKHYRQLSERSPQYVPLATYHERISALAAQSRP